MITGAAYGVILNDRRQLASRAAEFESAPYKSPPVAPVLYIKPRNCFSAGGAPVRVPATLEAVEVAATIGLLFGDAGVVAACLAVDVSEPHASLYRPAIVERCRDGFLPLGPFGPSPADPETTEIVTQINGADVHRWSLTQLSRDVAALQRDIGAFMTLGPGDLLLVGLAGDPPRAGVGDRVAVTGGRLPPLRFALEAEDEA